MSDIETNYENPINGDETVAADQNNIPSDTSPPPETLQTDDKSVEGVFVATETDSSEIGQGESEPAEAETPEAEPDKKEPAPEGDQPVLEQVLALTEKVAGLAKLFEAKILHTEHEEKIVDKMHSELQRYKEDLYSQLVRPILMDVIEIRDSIRRMADVRKNKPLEEQSIPLKDFTIFIDEIDIILDKNNIEVYSSTSGSDFVPVRQRVTQKVVTHDQALHGKIASSLSDGYNYNGKTISAEKVSVYLYEAQAAEPAENKEEINNG